MVLVIALNSVGMGPKRIFEALEKIEQDKWNIRFCTPITHRGLRALKYIFLFLIGIIKKHDNAVILNNYLPFKVARNQILLCRDSFLLNSTREYWLKRQVFYLSVKKADKVVVQTSKMRDAFQSMYPCQAEKVIIVPNPLRPLDDTSHVAAFDQIEPGSKIVLYPSSYYSHKGLGLLFDMLEKDLDNFLNERYVFVFCFSPSELSANENEKLMRLSSNLFIFLGNVTALEMNFLLKFSRYGIFPSVFESFGNGMQELAAKGLPYIYNEVLEDPCPSHGTPFNFSSTELSLFQGLQDLGSEKLKPYTSWLSVEEWFETISGGAKGEGCRK